MSKDDRLSPEEKIKAAQEASRQAAELDMQRRIEESQKIKAAQEASRQAAEIDMLRKLEKAGKPIDKLLPDDKEAVAKIRQDMAKAAIKDQLPKNKQAFKDKVQNRAQEGLETIPEKPDYERTVNRWHDKNAHEKVVIADTSAKEFDRARAAKIEDVTSNWADKIKSKKLEAGEEKGI